MISKIKEIIILCKKIEDIEFEESVNNNLEYLILFSKFTHLWFS